MIISCEHNPGSMGLCTECSKLIEESFRAAEKASAKHERILRMIEDLEYEGEYSVAARMRKKLFE